MGFALGLTNGIHNYLTSRGSVNASYQDLNPFPYYDYVIGKINQDTVKEAANAAYDCVITNQSDLSYDEIKGCAGVLGDAIGKSMYGVEFEVAATFCRTMKRELITLIKARELEDGDSYMSGMH